jgi:ribose/xylose/arabinose/galactoside ABC-type transport system permease subunit
MQGLISHGFIVNGMEAMGISEGFRFIFEGCSIVSAALLSSFAIRLWIKRRLTGGDRKV